MSEGNVTLVCLVGRQTLMVSALVALMLCHKSFSWLFRELRMHPEDEPETSSYCDVLFPTSPKLRQQAQSMTEQSMA
jgi:hypothetical protein